MPTKSPTSDLPPNYVDRIGVMLHEEISSIRKFHGAPILTGRAIEHAIVSRLRQFLPSRIELGSGLVCYGSRVSGEMDIVLFDRHNAPVFGTDANRIYPCEGVVAVIEVKSRLDKPNLAKAFKQVLPVRAMRRQSWEVRGRSRPDAYVIGADSTKIETLARTHVDLVNEQQRRGEWLLAPTVVLSLEKGVLAPCGTESRVHYGPSPNAHAGVAPVPRSVMDPFSYLVRSLWFSWGNFSGRFNAAYNDYFGPMEMAETARAVYFENQRPPHDELLP